MEEVRLLRNEFDKEFIHYSLLDKEDQKWYIYSVYDRIQETEWYEVFKYKITNNKVCGKYQCYPAVGYEKNDWYCVCDTEDDCYDWLKEKKLIEGIIENK